MAQKKWNVYLFGNWIDTVYFTLDCDVEYIRSSLINHDGYDSRIQVKAG